MTITLPRPLAAALALGALALTSSAAFASSHPVGPYTKAQTYAICDDAHGQRTAGPGQWGCEAARFAIACTEAGKLCMIDLFGTLADGSAQPRITTAAVIGSDGGPAGTGGTGGGFGTIGGQKVDASGLSMGQPDNFGGGNTIITGGGHQGYGGPLH